MIDELEHQADALNRLDRTDEVRAIEERIKSVRKTAAEIQSVSHDADAQVKLSEGALYDKSSEEKIAKLGNCSTKFSKSKTSVIGRALLRIPECSTLIYYGSDANAMYEAIQPTLRGDSQWEGALITIRQGSQQREVLLPRRIVN